MLKNPAVQLQPFALAPGKTQIKETTVNKCTLTEGFNVEEKKEKHNKTNKQINTLITFQL